ncbi:MAG: VTC domain-containing protein, partial [Oscillospiraceae bacterium]|nr:VTC domain-containing protein [Oscillospiraceae bacterium]
MDFRHEWKHEVNYCDMLALRQRLGAVLKRDPHALNGKYYIRSLYFDNIYDKALREKLDGVNFREKFRIRYYNGDLSYIMLEKKSKMNSLTSKEQAHISRDEAQRIVDGDLEWMKESGRPLVQELYS